MGGMYDISGKSGVYFEVTILQMDGVVAIGMFSDFSALVLKLRAPLWFLPEINLPSCLPWKRHSPGSAVIYISSVSVSLREPLPQSILF